MADKVRVHMLSKELGVTSKAIIAKCKSEGVEGITNHMSTVSAGLCETIREWFSEGEHRTAVETAAPVDLEKVKAKRRRSKKKAAEPVEAPPAETDVAVEVAAEAATEPVEQAPSEAVEEAPSTTVEAPPTEPEPAAPSETPAPVQEPVQEKPPIEPAPAEPAPVEVAAQEPAPAEGKVPEAAEPVAEAPAVEEPKQPENVQPAGPQNVPAPAQMKGPQVIGFAKPDLITPPTPRAPRPPMDDVDQETDGGAARGKGRGKGPKGGGGGKDAQKRSRHRVSPRRSVGSLSEVGERLREWNDRDLLERQERIQAASGRGIHARRAMEKKTTNMPGHIAPRKTRAQITEPIVAHELCAATGIGMMQIMPRLKRDHGLQVARNTIIPSEIAEVVMLEFGVELEIIQPKTELEKLIDEYNEIERKNPKPRSPVVTMLGHVDHGKTSLLDMIRKTSVASGEAGGITQHIGAYQVERDGLAVTFLDTPGHQAFTAMRARGANITDIVVLVVAADDGVMPQTVEAINHAKAAKVHIVIALNKIDLPGVDVNKVYGQLAEMELTPTEWGGETDVVKTSATTGEGVEELVAHLATMAELLDLKADPTIPASGIVVEAKMQTGMGPLARVLIKEGTLKRGDFVVCGAGAGRVRSISDYRGKNVNKATPAMPVELAGLDEVPNAGDKLYVVDSLQRAKQIADETKNKQRKETLGQINKPQTLEDLFKHREAGEVPELNLIMRSDVQGSVDAVVKTLSDIPGDQVKLNFLHTGIGAITEGDVVLAEASGALVVGFNVTADPSAKKKAEQQGVDIRLYRVIYELADDIRRALEGLLPSDKSEETRGRADVREIFHLTRIGTVAGCYVTEGPIARNHYLRVIRDGQIVVPTDDDVKHGRHRSVASLKRFKEDAREVRAGMECGIRVDGFDDLKPGDVIESYEVIETARKL